MPESVRSGRCQGMLHVLSGRRKRLPITTMLANNRGFTLIELMIVTAVGGLLAALAVPLMSNQIGRYGVQGAAKQVAWELIVSRAQAIGQNQNVIVQFPNDHEYAIGPDTNNNGTLDVSEAETTNIQDDFHGVTLAATAATFTLTPTGSSTSASTITFTIASETQSITVTVAGVVKID